MIVDVEILFEQSKIKTKELLWHAVNVLKEMDINSIGTIEIDDCLRIAEISAKDYHMSIHARDTGYICSVLENIAESLEAITESLEGISENLQKINEKMESNK